MCWEWGDWSPSVLPSFKALVGFFLTCLINKNTLLYIAVKICWQRRGCGYLPFHIGSQVTEKERNYVIVSYLQLKYRGIIMTKMWKSKHRSLFLTSLWEIKRIHMMIILSQVIFQMCLEIRSKIITVIFFQFSFLWQEWQHARHKIFRIQEKANKQSSSTWCYYSHHY